ncbi:MAG: hypothetical protein KZQ77_15740 [Candidatus Thiodiazotropha sp. (ex Notomyrtea botanica)]|nr:hypothetical protein [Candidatus Thiodiazotropha sp. (ex Notomyrtea botanica)]
MPEDNILPFPNKFRDTLDDTQWQALQGEFYLDCYHAHHGHPAENPDSLRDWLQEAGLYADMENAFFRGWLLRRLSETTE